MSSSRSTPYHHNVVPDRIDRRDRRYQPLLHLALPARIDALRDRRRPIALARVDQRNSLGMQRYFDKLTKHPALRAQLAPGAASSSSTHAGFDTDPKTLHGVIGWIKG